MGVRLGIGGFVGVVGLPGEEKVVGGWDWCWMDHWE